MKLLNKIGVVALAAGAMTSCAVHDVFDDNGDLGQILPTVSWELGSTTCKAGNDATFKAKYYYKGKDDMIDHTEVWALIARTESAAATCKLTTALNYTQTVGVSDTVRTMSLMKTFEHKNLQWNAQKTIADFNKVYAEDGVWEDEGGKYNSDYHIDMTNGYEYILTASFPTSATLAPVSWVNPTTFDSDRFDALYPASFKSDFVAKVVDYLTKDSAYYNDLRNVYVNYDFTAERFAEVAQAHSLNFPTETEAGNKSDLWYTDTKKVVGKYYITVENGVTYYHEVALDYEAPEGINLYDVYDSSEWVFCRYSDDTGSILTSVRAKYMPLFIDLLNGIPFEDWIYNTADQNYSINFSRDYRLVPLFKAVDINGKVGVTTNDKEISLN